MGADVTINKNAEIHFELFIQAWEEMSLLKKLRIISSKPKIHEPASFYGWVVISEDALSVFYNDTEMIFTYSPFFSYMFYEVGRITKTPH